MGNYYLYRHVRLDTNEIFYVGVGTKIKKYNSHKKEYQRAYSKSNRNKFWRNIALKTDFEVEIMMESEDHSYIKKSEIEFITLYGRRDLGLGALVNLTDGGEGVLNINEDYKRRGGKLILNYLTGIYYQSIKEAAISHNMRPANLENALKGVCANRTPFIYAENGSIYPSIPNVVPIYKVTEETKQKMRGERPNYQRGNCINSKKVINKVTGEIYTCRKELTDIFGYSYGYYGHMLNPNGNRRNTTDFEYYDEEKHSHILKNNKIKLE